MAEKVIEDDGTNVTVALITKDTRDPCPVCHCKDVLSKGPYPRHLKHQALRKDNLDLIIFERRYKCKNCGKTYYQNIEEIAEPRKQRTNYTTKGIMTEFGEDKTLKQIAKEYDVSVATVFKILDDYVPTPKRKTLPVVLCIDEFHFTNDKKYGKYPSVLSNYFTGKIIDLIRSRRKPYLIDYFSKIPANERKYVKYFVSDMNETYRSIRKIFFPEAKHVIDNFHITELFTSAIQKLRKDIMNAYKEDEKLEEYKFLKGNWKLFDMHQDTLKQKSEVDEETGIVYDLRLAVNTTLKRYPKLNKVYQAYEDFYKFTKKEYVTWEECNTMINFFINQFLESDVEELRSIGRTFDKWRWEFMNTFTTTEFGCRLSNAVAEGNNNFIQTLIDSAYGIKLFNHLRKRIFLISEAQKKD